MESPEVFFEKFVLARNTLLRRHQGELEKLQAEFCLDRHIYDKRLAGFDEEHILSVTKQGTRAEITTNGTTKGKYAKRMRYVLSASDGAWFVFDSQLECPICNGSGLHSCSGPQCELSAERANSPAECKVCKGKGWVSVREQMENASDD
jgi:hypothetical protein